MNSNLRLAVVLMLCGAILFAGTWTLLAATNPASPTARPAPGVEAAQTLSLITGVAISPLLGVGAVGAYEWWRTPEAKRSGLPWFAQTWFWMPALLLVGLVGLKDILGTAAPTALKKPFDILEAIENKISGLIAAGAFVPLIISVFPQAPGTGDQTQLAALGFATISGGAIGNALLVPLALVIFAVVWLASHAINILIVLSPFSTVDTVLKGMRLMVLSLVTLTAFANPYVGAAFAAVIIVLAYFLAGWSLRLTVFGTMYICEFLTRANGRFEPAAAGNRVFTARRIQDVPIRTYGELTRDEQGQLRLSYRPWFVFKRRTLPLPAGRYAVGRGLFYSEIARLEAGKASTLLILPPRYQTHEEAVARIYGLEIAGDVGLRKGLKAMWGWLRGFVGGERKDDGLMPGSVVPATR